MSEEPTRAIPQPSELRPPVHGSLGPADPYEDPVTRPVPTGVEPVLPEPPTVPTVGPPPTPPAPPALAHTRSGGLWTGLVLSALVLLLLLIFILQNLDDVRINFLGATGTLPTGVALLLAAVAGLLLVAIPGGLRMLQLRKAARRGNRQVH